ncbi:MAG: WD40/YVTN/BNR-like repeat-containing protein [Planctomycetaceae bacterium]
MRCCSFLLLIAVCVSARFGSAWGVEDASPLLDKAKYFQQDLIDKHWLDGLYVSIVPAAPPGTVLPHTVNEPGNVIHSGVWTGRYLAGVAYQYAVTRDPWVREHGGDILKALRRLQEVTGKPGLLARGYVLGHGPVQDWERDGGDSREWHQGTGAYADYRWYGDVSQDNFNAVLYGYAVYYDLAADAEQKAFIAHDVRRLMTHLVENHCRIVDVDGEVTQWGHLGFDPDPSRDEYYNTAVLSRFRRWGATGVDSLPLRASLLLLPDLLIARHITGEEQYFDLYRRVVARFKDNPEPESYRRPYSPASIARTDHSSEGQRYEALYNLMRYERDPELLTLYGHWLADLWEHNWMEGNSLFAYTTFALWPEYQAPAQPGQPQAAPDVIPHAAEALELANNTLRLYPIDRALRPVMNSLRDDIELNPEASRSNRPQSARPLPINERPLDNEYVWKGDPYQLDGWLKPAVTAFAFSCDDPQVVWFADSAGRLFMTLDGAENWQSMMTGLRGASVQNIVASDTRTFVLWAKTSEGVFLTRDGGMSWRPAPQDDAPEFPERDLSRWHQLPNSLQLKIDDQSRLVRSTDGGVSVEPAMDGWRIPRANSLFDTPWGTIAGGPGGTYRTADGKRWEEMKLWRENETGAADYLHAYWMGRYYGFVPAE